MLCSNAHWTLRERPVELMSSERILAIPQAIPAGVSVTVAAKSRERRWKTAPS